EERLAYERAQRIKAMDRVRTRLEKLQRRIVDGTLKVAEKVGAAATRVLARNHGQVLPLCSPASSLLWQGPTSRVRSSSASAPHLPDADRNSSAITVRPETSQVPMRSFCT